MSWFWSSGGSILTLIIKQMRAAKCNKTPSSPVNHRRSTDFLTITKTCSFSNFNLKDNILGLLCLAWFTAIPGTGETFSQVALDI